MINTQQLNIIKDQLLEAGVVRIPLQDDLLDHMGCVIEEYLNDGVPFDEAIEMAKERIAPNGFKTIENDLNYLLTINRNTMIRKIVFILGYVSVLEILMAIALYTGQILDWEVSGLIAMGGLFLFSISVVPYFFYQQYRKSLHKLQQS